MKRLLQYNTWMRRVICETAGSACIAAGLYNFAVQAQFPMSGFSGISILLYRLFGFPIGLCTVVLNIPVGVACYRLLGRSFFISSIRCMAISSFLIDAAAPRFPVYSGSRLLAALCAGVFMGIGYALIYMQGSSTGGMDFIVMAIKKKKQHLPVGRIIFLADMGVIAAGGILLNDMDGIIYGLMISFILSVVVDKMMYGANAGKMALIITDRANELAKVIDRACGRGTTIWEGNGGYRGERRQIVLCACSSKEMYLVCKQVKEADPGAFVIIMESSEVHGEGFRNVRIGA